MVRFLRRGHSLNRPEQGEETYHTAVEGNTVFYSQGGGDGRSLETQQIGCALDRSSDRVPKSRLGRDSGCRDGPPSDMGQMKEKFAKLLLGEDMSGGGKGVSSALALSNAITNLAGIGYLDNFKGHNEFWYVSKDADESEKGNAKRSDDKWWLPIVKVPPNGLSEVSRKWLQFQKESVNQVLKAAMAINAQNGRASLGDAIYRCITDDAFDPEQFLESMDLSTEHKVLDLENRIEASIIIWMRKMHNKDTKSSWGSAVSMEKREQFEERAEAILHLIKQRFPGIPQSALDTSKIQYTRVSAQSRIKPDVSLLVHHVPKCLDLYAGCRAVDPGKLLEDLRELGFRCDVADRRCPPCRLSRTRPVPCEIGEKAIVDRHRPWTGEEAGSQGRDGEAEGST
ncbi:hypothetical protein BHE74_00001808 [Ensete ventricosum]|uniref:PRONE domain-containing protein n=1 Tax=Ensete ventricosum TaxID=4639 RepID=A0A445MAI7_ENSVE|nr:hypothetical protein BHE74_00001808 [Ensete ventricosum]RZR71267.1 hypothetical protein BHM03_00004268 [Ensete ventricosum]